MKAIIIHGWDGNPKLHWYPWLKNELEKLGWEVVAPHMPNTSEPVIEEWVERLDQVLKNPDEKTYLIGHSIGCQTITRYLEKHNDIKLGGVVYVAGWFSLKNLDGPKEKAISKPWLETPIDYEKVKAVTKNVKAIFSDNDQFVPFEENVEWFKKRLNAEIIVENGKGHMIEEDGIKELPSVLKALI